jgi:hypothetical protein
MYVRILQAYASKDRLDFCLISVYNLGETKLARAKYNYPFTKTLS